MGLITETYKVSAKTQEVVDDYDNYVAGGFAPYPVSALFVSKRCRTKLKKAKIALTRVKGAKG
jgi:hypothetical protein